MRRTRIALMLLLLVPVLAIVFASNAPADRKRGLAERAPSKRTSRAPAPVSRLQEKASDLTPIPPKTLDRLPSVPPSKQSKPAKKSSKPRLSPEEAQKMSVLMDIWKRQGGDIFSGTIFEKTELEDPKGVEREFADALRRVMAQARQEKAEELRGPEPRVPASSSEEEEIKRLAPWRDAEADSIGSALYQSLQSSCRLLEAKANVLEEQRQYKEADALRRLANKMRKAARKHEKE